MMKAREFRHIAELKKFFPNADLIVNGIFVFNIKGNNYRLIVGVDFNRQAVFIKWFVKTGYTG